MELDSRQLIDVQFDRAVQLVQSLPKTGPIQTDYEEKLEMYSLYKQATIGNVRSPRPGIWDMLGRAKWDAWAKHRDLVSFEAKWLYVDKLLRVLRRYSDKTVARDMIKELESCGVDSSSIMKPLFSNPRESDSGSSSSSAASPSAPSARRFLPQGQLLSRDEQEEGQSEDEVGDELGEGLHGRSMSQSLNQSLLNRPQSSHSTQRYRTPMGGSLVMSPPPPLPIAPVPVHPFEHFHPHNQQQFPQSANQSSVFVQPQSVQHTYDDTSLPGSFGPLPGTQPRPEYETPSAFPGPSPPASSPGTGTQLPLSGVSHSVPSAVLSASGTSSYAHVTHPFPARMYPGHPAYRAPQIHGESPTNSQDDGAGMSSGLPGTRSPLERAVEHVQTHLAALQERMEMLEAHTAGRGTPYDSRASIGIPAPGTGSRSLHRTSPYGSFHSGGVSGDASRNMKRLGSPFTFGGGGGQNFWRWLTEFDEEYFDWEHMGLWSVALAPLARLTKYLTHILAFLLARRTRDGEHGLSPGMVVLRRLLLDASFIICVLITTRRIWRKMGVRRREVLHALGGVWKAVIGQTNAVTRTFEDRGI